MRNHLLLFLSLLLTSRSNGENPTNTTSAITMYPMQCSTPSPKSTCNSFLYVPSAGLPSSVVASVYSANATLIRTVFRQPMIQPDFLVQVPCGCEDTGTGTIAYFHNTKYRVQRDDTRTEITTKVFSGLAWNVTSRLQPEQVITINLLCGCYDGNDQAEVVSYTVQQGDTLSTIASLLSADWGEIVRMNGEILKNPEFLIPGWVLFVPMGTAVAPPNPKGKKHNIALIMGISISMAFIIIGGLLLILCRRRQSRQQKIEEENKVERNASIMSIAALESQYHPFFKQIKLKEDRIGEL